MKAMILAAGEGKRMLPLTANTSKCLLRVGKLTLLEHQLLRLQQNDFNDIVINVARYRDQIQDTIGDGSRFGMKITYSEEGDVPLETGGGIAKALPLLGSDPFLIVNADVWTDYPFKNLRIAAEDWVHLVLVNKPAYATTADFAVCEGRLSNLTQPYTYSGIGILSAALFSAWDQKMNHAPEKSFKLLPLLINAIAKGKASAEHFQGIWKDVGTPQRLAEVNEMFCLKY